MPPPTHFERLGMPGRFSVDPAELERAYLARAREVHPDFDAAGLDESAALNEAYATLKDPFRRAEYLLALHGGAPAARPLLPAFLMQAMEFQERVEGAAGDAGELARIDAELARLIDAEHAAVARLLDGEPTPDDLTSVLCHLNDWQTLAALRRRAAASLRE